MPFVKLLKLVVIHLMPWEGLAFGFKDLLICTSFILRLGLQQIRLVCRIFMKRNVLFLLLFFRTSWFQNFKVSFLSVMTKILSILHKKLNAAQVIFKAKNVLFVNSILISLGLNRTQINYLSWHLLLSNASSQRSKHFVTSLNSDCGNEYCLYSWYDLTYGLRRIRRSLIEARLLLSLIKHIARSLCKISFNKPLFNIL